MLGIGRPSLQLWPLPTAHFLHWKSAARFYSCFSDLSPNNRSRYTRSIVYSAPSCNCVGPLLFVRRIPSLHAQKKHSGDGETVLEGEDSIDLDFDADDDAGDYDDIIDEEEDGVEDGADDDIVLESDQMDDWLGKEPRGFGVGKVYNTSVEDKLLEEFERSRKTQLTNINELKSRAADPNKNKTEKEDNNVIASGIRVRISQLPKKKNIQRDLNAAFKGIPGIVNITPLVSGNKKTRDPVCKGLAFVDFKSPEDAHRFIGVFSSQNVGFGKVMKQIKCELVSSSSLESSLDVNKEGYNKDSNVSEVVPDLEEVNLNEHSEDSAVLDDEHMKRILEDLNKFEQEGMKLKAKHSIAQDGLSSPEEDSPTRKVNKPRAVKKKTNKVTASSSPKVLKPAKRLQAKEKSMFVDVISRYGPKLSSATKDRR